MKLNSLQLPLLFSALSILPLTTVNSARILDPSIASRASAPKIKSSPKSICKPLKTTFGQNNAGYRPIGSSTLSITPNGLEMYLERPQGTIKVLDDGTNDKVAEGATVNGTVGFLYGKVTYELSAPAIPGVVTAAILVSDSPAYLEEIDIEILGSEPHSFQTNIFAPSPKDKGKPLYGVLSGTEKIKGSKGIQDLHKYSIDWNEERIVWSVGGEAKRTMQREETKANGALHYPSHPMRVQLGIWDASSPVGTAEWAKGPIDWDGKHDSKHAHLGQITAVVKSVELECPYV